MMKMKHALMKVGRTSTSMLVYFVTTSYLLIHIIFYMFYCQHAYRCHHVVTVIKLILVSIQSYHVRSTLGSLYNLMIFQICFHPIHICALLHQGCPRFPTELHILYLIMEEDTIHYIHTLVLSILLCLHLLCLCPRI